MSNDLNPLYGLWSATDRSWVGRSGNKLPLLFSDALIKGSKVPVTGFEQAKIEAKILTERFKSTRRFVAKIYDGTAKATIRDHIKPMLTPTQAINRMQRRDMKQFKP